MYNPYNYNSGITWVNGIEGAKAYQMMAGTNAILMDSENEGTFYIKVADNLGMCTIRSFKFEEITTKKEPTNYDNFVQKDELKAEVEKLRKELADVKQFIQPTQQKLEI